MNRPIRSTFVSLTAIALLFSALAFARACRSPAKSASGRSTAAQASAVRSLSSKKESPCIFKISWAPNGRIYCTQPIESELSSTQPHIYTPDPNLPAEGRHLLQQMMQGPHKLSTLNALIDYARQCDDATRLALINSIISAMNDRNFAEYPRWLCPKALGYIRDERAVPGLIEALLHYHDSELVRWVASEAVGIFYRDFNNSQAHKALLESAGTETSPRIRKTLAKYLSKEMPAAPAPVCPSHKDSPPPH